MLPQVTVVIPFYNCEYVGNAIESVLYQTYANIELIVVDDGSTVNTNVLAAYEPYIKVIKKTNGGTASALNAGISQAKGSYIAWLSSDDVFYPRKLAVQMKFMLQHRASFSFTNFDMLIQDYNLLRERIVLPAASQFELNKRFLTECGINGCTAIMKKEMLSHVGLFDESLPYTHDYDLWVRILLAGYKLYYLDESLIIYRYHPKMGSRTFTSAQALEFEASKKRYRSRLLDFLDSQ
ncbi:MAG: glycosyl transferase family protein [Paenibacillus sp.]|nr:glycosyl transferase family protein [Paenibacillus sp.]